MQNILESLTLAQENYAGSYMGILRYAVPVLSAILLLRCVLPLLTFRREPEIWAWLNMTDGSQIPITHWENVIGRSKSSDVTIDFPTVSRNHAVLTRYDDGSWTITDAGSKDGTLVNGRKVQICALKPKDRISIGGVEMQLQPITEHQEARQAELRTKAASGWDSMANLMMLSILQCLMLLGFLLGGEQETIASVLMGFGGIFLSQWLLYIFYCMIRRKSFEVETMAFFLCTMGMAAIATVKPGETVKQLAAMALGVVTFLVIGWSLRDLERAKVVRYLATVAGVGFLMVTLVFGTEYYGAKNWLVIGGLSLQPSELSKVCFVYAGASTMDRIMSKRNIYIFIAYSILICGLLALMNDFGTALIFFCAFLVIAYLRSGSMGTVALAVTALIFAGVLALKMAARVGRSTERRLPAGSGADVRGLRRPVRSGAGTGLPETRVRGGFRHRLCHHLRGMGADRGGDDGAVRGGLRLFCHPYRTGRTKQLLFHRLLHRRQHSGHSDHSELSRHAGYSALHRRDLPVPEQRRHQHDRRMGAAGLRQGGGHPSECQLCRPPEQEGSVSG